jgi:hypothetical protein
MASPYALTNYDLSLVNLTGQAFRVYVAFMNPVRITTSWASLNQDAQGNWLPPPNFDTAANHKQPYAPTANLGSNRIGFVGEPLYFDGSRSTQRYDIPVITGSYVWTITGPASTTSYNGNSQVAISWSNPGLYTVSLSVKDRAGTAVVGTRQVMIYQDRNSTLPGVISVSGLSGSLANGGWTMQLTTVNSQTTILSPDVLPSGSYLPVVLLCETSYEVTPGNWVSRTIGPHGLFNPGYPYIDSRVLFDGYVQNGTIHQDVDKDSLSCTCVGPQMILQLAQSAQLGYYNCAYTSVVNNVPLGCKTSPAGQGYQVGYLGSADVIHSLLQDHCNIGTYHDIHIWNPLIVTNPYSPSKTNAYYYQYYTTLSVNQGTIWQCIGDLTANEWSQCYCERDGSIRVGPMVNYQGYDFWNQPTLLGGLAAPYLINLVQDLGYSTPGDLNTIASNIPILPATPMPIQFVHPWGQQQNPPQFLKPFGEPNAQIQVTQSALVGPPILCAFSDVPLYDQSGTPPDTQALFPWIVANWPQDLVVYPVAFDFQENYTTRDSLVKLITTTYGQTTLWSAWYPLSAFSLTGDGTVSIVQTILPAGNWTVDQSHLLPDITTNQNKLLVWNYLWEMARRTYYDQNTNYTGTITLGQFTAISLGDIVSVTRQGGTLGPKFAQKLFYVQGIDYSIDLTARVWQTSLTVSEVTSNTLGPIQTPPVTIPKA